MAEDNTCFSIQGDADETSSIDLKRKLKPEDRRTKLRRYDHIAAQALNAQGVAAIKTAPLGQLWSVIKAGNWSTMYFSEFADNSDYRRGVAISRFAECLKNLPDAIADPAVTAIIKPDLHAKVKAEVKRMEPIFNVLFGGKSAESSKPSLFSMGTIQTAKKKKDVEDAAKKLFAFLQNPSSTLRSFLNIMSYGGLFYAAMVHEKTARAAVSKAGGSITEEEFCRAAVARLCTDTPTDGEDAPDDLGAMSAALLAST